MITIRAYFIILMCSLSFYPHVGAAVTPTENAESLKQLQEELSIANENIKDLNTQLSERIKISGYADVEYETSSRADSNEGFRIHHLSLFVNKTLSEKWRFFSEIEYEDAPEVSASGTSGEILIEAANFSFLWKSYANIRAGRFFTPAGIWSVNHYPPFVPTQSPPQHIKNIFPQLVDGVMAYGTMSLGKNFINYDLYLGNGEGNTGEGDGNSDKAKGLNVYLLLPFFKHFEIGATYYTDTLIDETTFVETKKISQGFHAKFDIRNIVLQMEYATEDLEPIVGDTTTGVGYYAQLMYESEAWRFGLRHDKYDEIKNDNMDPITINSMFANYFIDENFVLKLERHVSDELGTKESSTIFSLGAYFTH